MKTTLDELQVFAAVVDTGSITAAAERLGQTVSGVSRGLSRLEEKLATTLLRRTTRRLELTEEGALLLQRARLIIDAVDEAEEALALRQQQPAGRLRVDTAAPFMLHVVVPLVAGFRARHPQIELELHTSDLFTDLLEHRTDVEAGDFIHIPAGVPHLPFNDSDAPLEAVIARTDPNEQESVVPLPELDELPQVVALSSVG